MHYPKTAVINFENPPTLGTYKVYVDTKNGDDLKDKSYFATIRLVSKYINKGGWSLFNGYFEGQEVTVADKDSRRTVVYFEPHNTGAK